MAMPADPPLWPSPERWSEVRDGCGEANTLFACRNPICPNGGIPGSLAAA
jgi:hypothetical protein